MATGYTTHHHTAAERRSLETWKYNFTVIIAHISSGESALRHILFQPYYIAKKKVTKSVKMHIIEWANKRTRGDQKLSRWTTEWLVYLFILQLMAF